MTILQIQAKVTKTAVFDGTGVDVSGVLVSAAVPNWTLVLEVMGMNAGDTARFQFTDSADNFSSDIVAGPTFSVTGQIGEAVTPLYPNVRRFSIKQQDFPDLRIGITSAKVRLSITTFSGSSKSVTYQAWLEY